MTNATEKQYGIVYLNVWEDNTISCTAKSLYSYLCVRAMNYTCCYPTVSRIKADTGISSIKIRKSMKELVEHGYIEIHKTKDGNRFSHNVYVIIERVESVENGEAYFFDNRDECLKTSYAHFNTTENEPLRNINTNNTISKNINKANLASSRHEKNVESVEKSKTKKQVLEETMGNDEKEVIETFEKVSGKEAVVDNRILNGIDNALKTYGVKAVCEYVINTVKRWVGTKYEKGIRLKTLFGLKFESYFNFKPYSEYCTENRNSDEYIRKYTYFSNDIDKYKEFINDF